MKLYNVTGCFSKLNIPKINLKDSLRSWIFELFRLIWELRELLPCNHKSQQRIFPLIARITDNEYFLISFKVQLSQSIPPLSCTKKNYLCSAREKKKNCKYSRSSFSLSFHTKENGNENFFLHQFIFLCARASASVAMSWKKKLQQGQIENPSERHKRIELHSSVITHRTWKRNSDSALKVFWVVQFSLESWMHHHNALDLERIKNFILAVVTCARSHFKDSFFWHSSDRHFTMFYSNRWWELKWLILRSSKNISNLQFLRSIFISSFIALAPSSRELLASNATLHWPTFVTNTHTIMTYLVPNFDL